MSCCICYEKNRMCTPCKHNICFACVYNLVNKDNKERIIKYCERSQYNSDIFTEQDIKKKDYTKTKTK